MTGARVLVPELLDALPADDPSARRSRRDLVRINRLMGTAGAVAGRLAPRLPAGRPLRLLEIGAGDGASGLAVVRRLPRRQGGTEGGEAGSIVLLDRLELVSPARRAEFAAHGWQAEPAVGDVRAWLAAHSGARFDAVFATLFLHHFDDGRLAGLLALLARTAPLVVAAEPRRDAVSLAAARLVGAIGANAVTRHDAAASVRAGFAGREIAGLWSSPAGPGAEGWRLAEGRAGPFAHVFVAARTAGTGEGGAA